MSGPVTPDRVRPVGGPTIATERLQRLRAICSSRWLRLSVLVVALGFLAAVLREQWDVMRQHSFVVQVGPLLLSYAPLVLAGLLEVWLWRRVLLALGYPLPFASAALTWFLSNLARYIPGNVWQFLGMMELAADSGVPRAATLTSVAIHQLLSNLAGLCLGAVAIGRAGVFSEHTSALFAFLALLAVLLLSPPVLRRLLALLARLIGAGTAPPRLSFALMVSLFCGYCAYWLAAGYGFVLLSTGLGMPPNSAILWIAAYAGAYVMGYLSLLTPSGIGVREGVLALLLAAIASPVPGALLAIAARLWSTVGEVAITALVAALGHGRFVVRRR